MTADESLQISTYSVAQISCQRLITETRRSYEKRNVTSNVQEK